MCMAPCTSCCWRRAAEQAQTRRKRPAPPLIRGAGRFAWKGEARRRSGDLYVDAVDLYALVGANEDVLDSVDDAGVYQIAPFGADPDGHVRGAQLQLPGVHQIAGAQGGVRAEGLVVLSVEGLRVAV